MIRNALTLLLVGSLWVVAGCEQREVEPAGQAEGLPQSESPDAAPGLGDEPARSPGAVPGGQVDRPAIDRPSPTPPPGGGITPSEPAPAPPPSEPASPPPAEPNN